VRTFKEIRYLFPASHTAATYKTMSQLTGSGISVTASWEKEYWIEYLHCCFENWNQLTELGLRTNSNKINVLSNGLYCSFPRNFLRTFKAAVRRDCNLHESESEVAKGGPNLSVLAYAVVSVMQQPEIPIHNAVTRSYNMFLFSLFL
jgi:hypothetical protein